MDRNCTYLIDNLNFPKKIFSEWIPYTANILITDYGRPVRKSPSLHGRKSNPNPKLLGTAEAYFVCHIGPKFQISLIYALIVCP